MANAKIGLRNLGEEEEELLEAVGITTKAQFERLGAEQSYRLILESGHGVDTDLLYRLRGAEEDIDWHIVAKREKQKHKSRYIDVDEP